LITPLLKDVGHRVRLGGNLGAHPDSDGLRDVTEGDARALVAFMDSFIEYVYAIPASLRQATRESEGSE
jgi:hypothetical protein